jgi:undecaprenyl-diphosphatase
LTRRSRIALVAVPVLVFGVLAALIPAGGGPFGFDRPVADLLAAIAPVGSSEVHIDPGLTLLTAIVAACAALLLVALLARRELRAAAFVVIAIAGTIVLAGIAKAIFERPPIDGPPDAHSFPSGSAAGAAAAFMVALLLTRGRWERQVLTVGGAAVVLGYSSVIVWEQWHYPSDVLAGWCLGVAWAGGSWLALRRPSPGLAALGFPPSGRARSLTS